MIVVCDACTRSNTFDKSRLRPLLLLILRLFITQYQFSPVSSCSDVLCVARCIGTFFFCHWMSAAVEAVGGARECIVDRS
jgi:hypothetical protein